MEFFKDLDKIDIENFAENKFKNLNDKTLEKASLLYLCSYLNKYPND